MTSDIYWIDTGRPLRLAIMARPRAGDWLDDEVDNWLREGVETVVSLLEDAEVRELGLEAEADLCRARGLDFVSFPISDRGVPADLPSAVDLARRIQGSGRATAIHCRAGIGRSALLAAAVLALEGVDADAAFAAIGRARGLSVPDTEVQRAWVAALGQELDWRK